jgi:hypothetical protein
MVDRDDGIEWSKQAKNVRGLGGLVKGRGFDK